MTKLKEGVLHATGKKFCIVVSRFNDFITNRLVEGAVDTLVRHGAQENDIEIVRVPGSFEIPPVAAKITAKRKHDAVICVGAVIRGDTPHFDYIASEVSKGVATVGLNSEIPVIFGVLTTDTIEQAIERAGTKAGNKGADAALAAIELVDLYSKI